MHKLRKDDRARFRCQLLNDRAGGLLSEMAAEVMPLVREDLFVLGIYEKLDAVVPTLCSVGILFDAPPYVLRLGAFMRWLKHSRKS